MGKYADQMADIAMGLEVLGAMLDEDLDNGTEPPQPPDESSLSGVYTGSSDGTGNAERDFGNWRGREVETVLTFTPDDTWSSSWWMGQFGGDYPWRDRLCITRGLCLKTEDVDHSSGWGQFGAWARAAKEAGIERPIFRLGHEANGDWYAWRIEGHEDTWATAFERAADEVHQANPDARVMLNMAAGQPLDGFRWPDAEAVDMYSVDLYDVYDATEDWPNHVRIARDYGVSLSLPEWGLWSTSGGGHGDNPGFIDWVADTCVPAMAGGFEAYFNKDSSSVHKLSSYPSSEQRYQQRFGGTTRKSGPAPFVSSDDPSFDNVPRWRRHHR